MRVATGKARGGRPREWTYSASSLLGLTALLILLGSSFFFAGCRGPSDAELAWQVAWREDSTMPKGLESLALACQPSGALVLGMRARRGDLDDEASGPVAGLTSDAVAVRFRWSPSLDKPEFKGTRALGPGFVIAISQPTSTTVVALLGEWHRDRGRTTRLMATTDFGTSWEVLETPLSAGEDDAGPLTGLAFTSAHRGYVWTWSVLFRTEDGGATWRKVVLPNALGGASAPFGVDLDDRLWMASSPHPTCEQERQHLYRITPDLEVGASWALGERCIGALSVGPDGSVWTATTTFGQTGVVSIDEVVVRGEELRLHSLQTSPGSGKPMLLQARGRQMLLLLDATGEPGLFRSVLSVSSDRGRSWREVTAFGTLRSLVCRTESGELWVANQAGYLERLAALAHDSD